MGSFNDLIVYKKAFELAMSVFEITKNFPSEEKWSLISQVRRSTRAVCSNIAEGYRKRQYQAHFIAKISDADMENTESLVWLDFALSCGYITEETYQNLRTTNNEIGKLLGDMLKYPEKYSYKNETIK